MRRALAGLLLSLSFIVTACDPAMLASLQKPGDKPGSVDPVTGTTVAPKDGTLKGIILSPEGKPVSGAKVRAFAVPSDLTTVAPLATVAPLQQAAAYRADRRVAATSGEVTTDQNGAFAFPDLEGTVNVEAVMSDAFKLFKSDVTVSKAQPASLGQVTVQPTGTITGKVSSADSQVTNFEGVDVFIPGSSYVAKADMAGNFTLANVAPGTFTLVATKTGLGRAYAGNVSVNSNASTTVNLALSLSLPKITQVTPPNGGPGSTITLSGENFGATKGEQLAISFTGAPATTFQRTSDTTIQVTVPVGAQTGNVFVTVGGNQSNAVSFKVLKDVFLNWPTASLDLFLGSTFTSTPSANDTGGALVISPSLKWELASGDSVELLGNQMTAVKAGDATLKLSSGNAAALGTVHVFGVTGVTLDRSDLTLNAMPEQGPPDPGFVTSATLLATVLTNNPAVTNRKVTWHSSNPQVTVVDGLVQTIPGAAKGTAIVTATSVDDPTFKAQATVSVTVYGGINLEVK